MMKGIVEMDRTNIIKEIFIHKGRICVVIEMRHLKGIPTFHNGYVQTAKRNYGKDYNDFVSKISTDELTFAGNLPAFSKDIWFFGFDSAHHWNDLHPESKSFESVKKRTIELCEEMVRKRI